MIAESALRAKPAQIPRMVPLRERVKQAIEAGHSQAALCRATGLTSGAVSQWASGTVKAIKSETAAKLAKLTGWSMDWWATGLGPREPSAQPVRAMSEHARALADLCDTELTSPADRQYLLDVAISAVGLIKARQAHEKAIAQAGAAHVPGSEKPPEGAHH